MNEPMPASGPDSSDGEMFVVDSPYEIANWRALVQWVLAIPHAIVLYVLNAVAGIVFLIYWVALIITGRLNGGMYGFLCMYERYQMRAGSFLYGFSEIYPPFDFETGNDDNGEYPPTRVNLPAAPDETSRVAALNFFLAIPHYIVWMVYGIAASFVAIAGWFAVLFTGRWPAGMRDFLVKVANYYLRIWVYVVMVDNRYPKFGI